MSVVNEAIVPAEPTETSALYVLFQVDGADYALPAEAVLQMESFTGATVVPGTQSFVAGIIQLRGHVVPVVDLRKRFGLPSVPVTGETRVVVGQLRERVVALVADTAREVLRLVPSQIKPPPRILEVGASGYVSAVAQVGPRTVLILDFAKVIGEETIDV